MSYSFQYSANYFLYAPYHRQDSMAFVLPVVEHWLEKDDEPSYHEWMLYHGATSCSL